MNAVSILAHLAKDRPNAPGIGEAGGTTLTNLEWLANVERTAEHLRAAGVRRGDHIALSVGRRHTVDHAVGYFALLWLGAVAITIDDEATRLPLALERVDRVSAYVVPEGGECALRADRPRIDMERPLAGHTECSSDARWAICAPGARAEVLTTSGTTGNSRAVGISHDLLLFMAAEARKYGDSALRPEQCGRPASRASSSGQGLMLHHFAPASSMAEALLITSVGKGQGVVTATTTGPGDLVSAIEEERPVDVYLAPFAARMLIAKAAASRAVEAVDSVTTSTAATAPETLNALATVFHRASVYNEYGLTECGMASTLLRSGCGPPLSVGRPWGATEVRILPHGPTIQAAVTETLVGEVALRYPGQPRVDIIGEPRTAWELDGGWTRTGDIGYLDPDGYLHLVDRAKDVINRGGLTLSPREIEGELCELGGIHDAVVVAVPSQVGGDEIGALVVLEAGSELESIRRSIHVTIPKAHQPARLEVVHAIPLTRRGKVDRRAALELLRARLPERR